MKCSGLGLRFSVCGSHNWTIGRNPGWLFSKSFRWRRNRFHTKYSDNYRDTFLNIVIPRLLPNWKRVATPMSYHWEMVLSKALLDQPANNIGSRFFMLPHSSPTNVYALGFWRSWSTPQYQQHFLQLSRPCGSSHLEMSSQLGAPSSQPRLKESIHTQIVKLSNGFSTGGLPQIVGLPDYGDSSGAACAHLPGPIKRRYLPS